MTKRPRQHQIEDLSRSKFSLRLPSNWVVRDKSKDYGIDAEVEIFDDNDYATGLVFLVQLKASESPKSQISRKINLRLETLNYYQSLDLPVLLVRYAAAEDAFFTKWAHEVDFYGLKENAKTKKIEFSDEHIWSEATPNRILRILQKLREIKSGLTLPIPMHLSIQVDGFLDTPRAVLSSRLRSGLGTFSDCICLVNKHEDAFLWSYIREDTLEVSLASLTHCIFHRLSERKRETLAQDLVADIVLGLATTLCKVGHHEIAAKIFFDDRIKERFFKREELLFFAIPQVISTSRYAQVIDAVCELIESQSSNILENLTLMASMSGRAHFKGERAEKHQQLLEKILETNLARGIKEVVGTTHYNLGNFFRTQGEAKKAIFHYLRARHFEPAYLDQFYYFQELGGALFLHERFRFSAKIYKKAVEKGAPDYVKAMYADALMFAGHYKQSLQVFEEFLPNDYADHFEWHLKCWALQQLISKTKLSDQIRQKDKAISLIDISKEGTSEFNRLLNAAIKLDNLCGLAWFNLGIVQSKSNAHCDAALSFILCGLIQTWDTEAWVNAVIVCLNPEVPIILLPLVLNTGYFFKRETFLTQLFDDLSKRFAPDVFGELSNRIDELLVKSNNNVGEPVFRICCEDGKFRNIKEIHDA